MKQILSRLRGWILFIEKNYVANFFYRHCVLQIKTEAGYKGAVHLPKHVILISLFYLQKSISKLW